MFAVTAARFDADNPLAGLELGERPDPSPPDGWEIVTVKAASLNHHDVWTLRGVGVSADRLPIILGCDAAGVDAALILLGGAAGYRVWATSRSEAKREQALALGADQVFPVGSRLPERVDAVMETVGQATWAHSLRALRPGGRIVISGATSGVAPPAELNRVFFLQLSVVGSTMGSRDQLARLATFLEQTGTRPRIDRT